MESMKPFSPRHTVTVRCGKSSCETMVSSPPICSFSLRERSRVLDCAARASFAVSKCCNADCKFEIAI